MVSGWISWGVCLTVVLMTSCKRSQSIVDRSSEYEVRRVLESQKGGGSHVPAHVVNGAAVGLNSEPTGTWYDPLKDEGLESNIHSCPDTDLKAATQKACWYDRCKTFTESGYELSAYLQPLLPPDMRRDQCKAVDLLYCAARLAEPSLRGRAIFILARCARNKGDRQTERVFYEHMIQEFCPDVHSNICAGAQFELRFWGK